MIIRGRGTKQDLTRRLSMKTRRRLEIDKIDRSRNSFTPKMRRHKGRNQEGTGSLNNMPMFTLHNSILGMSTRTRKLRKSTLRREKLTKSCRQIPPQNLSEKHE
jgi:hypothetical protein